MQYGLKSSFVIAVMRQMYPKKPWRWQLERRLDMSHVARCRTKQLTQITWPY
jgi:hypothetical protein